MAAGQASFSSRSAPISMLSAGIYLNWQLHHPLNRNTGFLRPCDDHLEGGVPAKRPHNKDEVRAVAVAGLFHGFPR